jgi:hypothetical protein
MPSTFAQEWAAAEPDLDAELGEQWRLLPQASPLVNGAPDVNARPVDDPDRPPVYFCGRFNEATQKVHPQGRAKPSSDVHSFRGAQPVLSLSSLAAAALWIEIGGAPRQGDKVARVETGEVFRIEDVQKLDLGMFDLELIRVASASWPWPLQCGDTSPPCD